MDVDGGLGRNVHHGARCQTLVVAAAIGRLNLAAIEVDDGGDTVGIEGILHRLGRVKAHAQTVVAARAKDGCRGKFLDPLGDVDEHVALVLRLVAFAVLRITGAAAEDTGDGALAVHLWTDVHEGVGEIRHREALVLRNVVVVAAVDGIDATLEILHVGG